MPTRLWPRNHLFESLASPPLLHADRECSAVIASDDFFLDEIGRFDETDLSTMSALCLRSVRVESHRDGAEQDAAVLRCATFCSLASLKLSRPWSQMVWIRVDIPFKTNKPGGTFLLDEAWHMLSRRLVRKNA